ncbi:hypothetical protein BBJ28_00022250, partial [Nothophytophthora sp. Chile5]
MAPSNATATPHPDVEFTTLKTPMDNIQDKRGSLLDRSSFGPSPWANQLGLLGNLAQVIVVAAIFVYAYGQLFYFSDAYTDKVSATIGTWFGVPVGGGKDAGGHSEMVRPMYFFLFGLIPIGVSLLLLEFLRHFNVRRISSRY